MDLPSIIDNVPHLADERGGGAQQRWACSWEACTGAQKCIRKHVKNQHNETSIKGHPPFLARGKASKSQCKHTLQTYTARKRVHIYIDILKRNRKKNNYEFINLFIFSNFPTLKKNPTLQNLSPSTFQKAPSLESQSSWHPPLGTALVAKEFFQWTSHGDVRSCLGCRLS